MDAFIRDRFLPAIFSTRARDVKQHQQVALRRETKVKTRETPLHLPVQYLVRSMGALACNSSSEERPRINSFADERMQIGIRSLPKEAIKRGKR